MIQYVNRRRSRGPRLGLLTVGETSRILGLSPSTLRLWEDVGLISPARSSGRYRLYSPELLTVLKRIKYLRDVKLLNLPSIKEKLGKTVESANGSASRPTALGPRLRRLRQERGLSVLKAATAAKISPGFLSAIELSRANPSVATLQRLTALYGTTVLSFYDMPKQVSRVVRPAERRTIRTQSGVQMDLLSIGAKQLQSMLFRVHPGGGSNGSYSHQGEEFIYMLKGTLEIWLDELECHTLHADDSFWFESTVGHRWYNPSADEDALLLWVNTPPTF